MSSEGDGPRALTFMDQDVRVHSLASGSSGNAMLVQAGEVNLLIDAGLPLRTLANRLAKHRVGTGNLHAVLLTHEHTDHCAGAGPIARRTGAPLLASADTLQAYACRDERAFPSQVLPAGAETTIGRVWIRSFPVPHDAMDPVGFVLEVSGTRIAYCTDVGSRTPEIARALRGAHLAILEANHDMDWLMRGPYTPQMKRRVASPTGHLSNADCALLLAERLEEGGPLSVWLAHLSRVNNAPALARRSVLAEIACRTRVGVRLEVALRDHPSVSWRSGAGAIQLSLF